MEAFQPCLTTIMFPWCQCKTWGWPLCCILEQLLHKKLHIQGLHYQKNQVRSWCCCMLERGVSENDLQILILPFLKLVRLEVGLPHFQTHQIKIQHLKLLQYPNIPSKILQYQLCIYIYIYHIFLLKSLLMLLFMFPHCWIQKKIRQIPSLNRCPATFSTSNFISASTSARARPWNVRFPGEGKIKLGFPWGAESLYAEGSIYCSPK